MSVLRQKWPLFALICAYLLCGGSARAEESAVSMDKLRRKTPSGQYVDPASFFRFHGYVSLSYSEVGNALGAAADGTPHILVSGPGPSARTGKNEGGFRNDAALFFGGEPFERVGSVIEIHFVGDATDPVLTEAKMTWDLVGGEGDNVAFRLIGGRYWWPFGIHNGEWFSAINRFALLSPAAAEGVPAHYNEVGIMGEGELRLQERLGLNYALSVGNGVPGFGLGGNVRTSGADGNGNRTLTGRVGLVLLDDLEAELGLSAASGALRAGEDASLDAGRPDRYAADFSSWGPDLTLEWRGVKLRSYLYSSTEKLKGASVGALERTGMTVEPSYTFKRAAGRFKAFTLVARYSAAEKETLARTTLKRTQIGIGLHVDITSAFQGRIGFVSQGEAEDLPEVDNNAFSIGLTSEF